MSNISDICLPYLLHLLYAGTQCRTRHRRGVKGADETHLEEVGAGVQVHRGDTADHRCCRVGGRRVLLDPDAARVYRRAHGICRDGNIEWTLVCFLSLLRAVTIALVYVVVENVYLMLMEWLKCFTTPPSHCGTKSGLTTCVQPSAIVAFYA